jgi:hypothetical protein
MVAKDLNGKLAGELHAGVHFLSSDGFAWEPATERKAYSRDIAWDDGAVRRMAHVERPFVMMQDGVPSWLFAAMAEGSESPAGGFCRLDRTWNAAIPLDRTARPF